MKEEKYSGTLSYYKTTQKKIMHELGLTKEEVADIIADLPSGWSTMIQNMKNKDGSLMFTKSDMSTPRSKPYISNVKKMYVRNYPMLAEIFALASKHRKGNSKVIHLAKILKTKK